MSKNNTYIIGINAYDHDVSACLLRDGEIAYAMSKRFAASTTNVSIIYLWNSKS
jgi:carbamoyltransferase